MYLSLHLLFVRQNYNVPDAVDSMKMLMPHLSLTSFMTTNKTTISPYMKTQDEKYPLLKKFPYFVSFQY